MEEKDGEYTPRLSIQDTADSAPDIEPPAQKCEVIGWIRCLRHMDSCIFVGTTDLSSSCPTLFQIEHLSGKLLSAQSAWRDKIFINLNPCDWLQLTTILLLRMKFQRKTVTHGPTTWEVLEIRDNFLQRNFKESPFRPPHQARIRLVFTLPYLIGKSVETLA